jgi:uncharacterized protein YndB with AHSA1/START domain
VYQALIDPAALTAWLPPGDMTAIMHRFDLRIGGGYEMSLLYPASENEFRGKTTEREDRVSVRLVELTPPSKIRQAVAFNSIDPAFSGIMKMTWSLEVVEGGSEINVICEDIPRGIRPEDNEAGCRSSLEKLARYLA